MADGDPEPSFIDAFRVLRTDPELEAERAGLAGHLDRPPDKTLQFIGEMDMSGMDMGSHGHEWHMGMDWLATDMSGGRHGRHDRRCRARTCSRCITSRIPLACTAMRCSDEGAALDAPDGRTDDGIEWEDTMPEMNVMSNLSNMIWKIVDTATGAANEEISWTLHVGDRLKIRLDNSAGSDHQMHHPFHIHGAGRFLVLDRGGVPEPNLVWKDTVLVRAGEVVHILFDVTNPGRWMAHCHIAEHIESRMMFSFDVLETAATRETTP